MDFCLLWVFCVSGRGLCDELITRPEESYRLWCVVVCDQENQTSWMRRPNPLGFYRAKKKKISLIKSSSWQNFAVETIESLDLELCSNSRLEPQYLRCSSMRSSWVPADKYRNSISN
jgi:hypothetical protein